MNDSIYEVTKHAGYFGGGEHPKIPAEVVMLTVAIPPGHHMIGGVLYRETSDPKELESIIYPDGSRPTGYALVPVECAP